MTPDQFRQLAGYNRWANARQHAATLALSDQAYRFHIGVFFGSLHGTLNHLLLTDRLWLKRLTGEGDHPKRLDAILYEDRAELTRARNCRRYANNHYADIGMLRMVAAYDTRCGRAA